MRTVSVKQAAVGAEAARIEPLGDGGDRPGGWGNEDHQRMVMGGHGRSRKVMEGHGRSRKGEIWGEVAPGATRILLRMRSLRTEETRLKSLEKVEGAWEMIARWMSSG